MSAERIGKPWSEMQRAAYTMSSALGIGKGKSFTEEHKAKISAANKGKRHSPETRAKMSTARMGNKNCLGRQLSPETRAKISAARRRELPLVLASRLAPVLEEA